MEIKLTSDALGIIKRIKSWNKKYEVYYNLKSKKFILYLIENNLKPKTYCLTFPYGEIDERMFYHTLKSEMQNRQRVLQEIEEHNSRLLKYEQEKIIKEMEKNCESKRNT